MPEKNVSTTRIELFCGPDLPTAFTVWTQARKIRKPPRTYANIVSIGQKGAK
jgi:hypothetical protein